MHLNNDPCILFGCSKSNLQYLVTYCTVKFLVMVEFVNTHSFTHDLLISSWGFNMILFSSKFKSCYFLITTSIKYNKQSNPNFFHNTSVTLLIVVQTKIMKFWMYFTCMLCTLCFHSCRTLHLQSTDLEPDALQSMTPTAATVQQSEASPQSKSSTPSLSQSTSDSGIGLTSPELGSLNVTSFLHEDEAPESLYPSNQIANSVTLQDEPDSAVNQSPEGPNTGEYCGIFYWSFFLPLLFHVHVLSKILVRFFLTRSTTSF